MLPCPQQERLAAALPQHSGYHSPTNTTEPQNHCKCLHFRFQLCSLLSSRSQLHGWLDECLCSGPQIYSWATTAWALAHSSMVTPWALASNTTIRRTQVSRAGCQERFPWPQQLAMGEKKVRRSPVALTAPTDTCSLGHWEPLQCALST